MAVKSGAVYGGQNKRRTVVVFVQATESVGLAAVTVPQEGL